MKKLQKLKLNQLQDYNAMNPNEQKMVKGGDGPPYSSWDSIPGGTMLYCKNDATYVASGSQIYEIKTGSTAGSTGFCMTPSQVSIGSTDRSASKQTLVQWYDAKVAENPSWDPFPAGSPGHTIMEYWSAW